MFRRLIRALQAGVGRPATGNVKPSRSSDGGTPLDSYNLYMTQPWLSTAIDRLSTIAASQEFMVWGESGEVKEHPLVALLGKDGRPGPEDTAQDFWERHYQRLDIYGNDVWLVVGDSGVVKEIQQLPMANVRVRYERGAWRYYYMSTELLLSAVVHIRRPDPRNLSPWGTGLVERMRTVLTDEQKIGKWNADWFAVKLPRFLGTVREASGKELSDLQVKLAEEQIALTDRLHLQNVVPHREADYIESRKTNRQTIFDASGLHTGAVAERSSEAHIKAAREDVLFQAWTRIHRTEGQIQKLLWYYDGAEGLRIQFTDPRRSDVASSSARIASMKGLLTVNEVRVREFGLGEIDSGEEIYR